MGRRLNLEYLSEEAEEGGTFPISISFTDEEYGPATVTAINWRLTDEDGNTINGRGDVSATPADPTVVTLEGDDLAITSGYTGIKEKRHFAVKVTFNSTLGTGKVQTKECIFFIKNSVALPIP